MLIERTISGKLCCTSGLQAKVQLSRPVSFALQFPNSTHLRPAHGSSTEFSQLCVTPFLISIRTRPSLWKRRAFPTDDASPNSMKIHSPGGFQPFSSGSPNAIDGCPGSVLNDAAQSTFTLSASLHTAEVSPSDLDSRSADATYALLGSDPADGYKPRFFPFAKSETEETALINRTANGIFVSVVAAAALYKFISVDSDIWRGWTFFEVMRNAPVDNWIAYEAYLQTNPVFAKMCISGTVYFLGDWSAQCVEGKGFLDFDRTRIFRSGMVGFLLHGSLSHYYYHFCEWLIPSQEWWGVGLKIAFDQTVWSGVWNSIYYTVLGLLRFENPKNILAELKSTFFPLLMAGWKLWPFAHVMTYGVVPLEQRLLWVDMVELVWVTILSMMSNEKAESRKSDEPIDVENEKSVSQNTPSLVYVQTDIQKPE